jgi:hypothetical protein
MAIYLKKFETQADYEAAESGLILPNVSLTVDNNTVHYNPSTPPAPLHDFIEIGGVKWATMNVGANSVTDTGLYFQWGDTQGYTAAQCGRGEGQKYFSWADYKYSYSSSGGMTKYNETDGKTVLDAEDDAVTAAWGGNWRMATVSEFIALGNAVNTAWTQVNGVYGLQCTDKTDSSKVLFFPTCGYCSYGSVYNVSSDGFYLSSSVSADCGAQVAYNLSFEYNNLLEWSSSSYERSTGGVVRGILDE